MLCQNCGKNEATTHLKRIINGEKAETHLCSQCASALGYGSIFSGFGLNLGDLLVDFSVNFPSVNFQTESSAVKNAAVLSMTS